MHQKALEIEQTYGADNQRAQRQKPRNDTSRRGDKTKNFFNVEILQELSDCITKGNIRIMDNIEEEKREKGGERLF